LQLELYPSATEADKKIAKALLKRYRKNKSNLAEFERKGTDRLAKEQLKVYNTAKKEVESVESAVRLILKPDIREMIEHKYINGELRRHKDTLNRFNLWDQSTVGRKLNEGIESVAGSIKLFNY